MTKAKNEIVENIREVKKKYNLSSLEIIKIINDEANHHIVNYMGKRVETAETVNITKENFKEIKKEDAINYYFLENGEMFAFSNDYTGLFSYIEDFEKEDQEFFGDLHRDTKDEEGVNTYQVNDKTKEHLIGFLESYYERAKEYEWVK